MKIIKKIALFAFTTNFFFNINAQDTLNFNGLKDFTDFITADYRVKYPSVQFFKYKLITSSRNIYDYYTGRSSNDSISNTLMYMGLLNDLNTSSFIDSYPINLDVFNKKMIEGANRKIIPLSYSLIEFHSFKDSTIMLNRIGFENNHFIDLSPSGYFPFKKDILFASSCLNEICRSSEVSFMLNDSLIFTNLNKNSISELSIDFDDGNNFVPCVSNSIHTVLYNTDGVKTIRVKLTHNNIVYTSKSIIQIITPNPLAKSAIDPPNLDCFISGEPQSVGPVNISTNILGTTVTGKFAVWFSGCNTTGKVRKPYIISAGFNPKNIFRLVPGLIVPTNFLTFNIGGNIVFIPTNFNFNFAPRGTYYESYNGTFSERYSPAEFEAFSCTKNGNNYMDRLRDEGYDIVILSYDDGEDKTINNAALFIELIQKINTEKFSNNSFIENVISGYSGGGVTSRLALALMESRLKQGIGPHHHSKLWVSFEGEQQGSNVPIGLQHFIDFQSDPTHLVPSLSPIHLAADMANSAMANVVKSIVFNNTSNELLAISALNNNQPTNERNTLNSLFTSIFGNASNGYQEFCRRVAVTQGSGLGINMNFSGNNIIDTQLKYGSGGSPAVSAPSTCGGSYIWKTPSMGKKTTALWNNPSNSDVFKANGFLDASFTILPLLCVNIPFVGCQCTGPFEVNAFVNLFSKIVSKPSSPPNYDQPASSVLSTHLDAFQLSAYGLYNNVLSGSNSFASKDPNFHGFSPVVSCLDIHDPNTGLPESNFKRIDNMPGGLNLLNTSTNSSGLVQHPQRRFGFPHLSHPSNHYAITPFDGVYCIGTANGFDLNNNPRPDNQAHVEDPQKMIGDYLARTEVAPIDLFLTNRTIGSTAVNNFGFVGNYNAEFEARDKIIVGKTDISGLNNIYSLYGNTNFLSKNDNFNVLPTCKLILHSGEFVEMLPGFDVPVGAELDAFIQAYNCADLLFRVNQNNQTNNNNPKHNLPNLGFNYDKPINKTIDKEINSFLLYPNPNNGNFTYLNVCSEEPTSFLIISNIEGKILYQNTIYNNSPIELNLSQLKNGLYLVKVINKNSSDNFKLTINN